MPWTINNFPASTGLSTLAIYKALEISNSLVKDGYQDDDAIQIGIDQAKKWEKELDPDETYHLEPYQGDWILKSESEPQPLFHFDTKDEAMNKIQNMLKDKSIKLVVHTKDGQIEKMI